MQGRCHGTCSSPTLFVHVMIRSKLRRDAGSRFWWTHLWVCACQRWPFGSFALVYHWKQDPLRQQMVHFARVCQGLLSCASPLFFVECLCRTGSPSNFGWKLSSFHPQPIVESLKSGVLFFARRILPLPSLLLTLFLFSPSWTLWSWCILDMFCSSPLQTPSSNGEVCSGWDGMASLAVVLALQRSSESGRPATPNEMLSGVILPNLCGRWISWCRNLYNKEERARSDEKILWKNVFQKYLVGGHRS